MGISMTTEEKELLLKDICGRLPYKVKVHDIKNGVMNLYEANGITGDVFISNKHIYRHAPIEDIKPYLFPMSSMTEEQLKLFDGTILPNGHVVASDLGLDYLNSIYVDYRGLIPMGLAIDATVLNIY